MNATSIRRWTLAALCGLAGCQGSGSGPQDPDGVACGPQPVQGRVYVEVDYGANAMPAAAPDRCEVQRGSTITWRGPPGETAEFGVVFPGDSPEGPRGSRVLASEPVIGREKITITAGNEPGTYKYDIEAYGRRLDPAIIIR